MVVDNHSDTWGGGIYTVGSASELLTVIDSTFSGNTAATNGGALAGVGPVTIVNTTFSGNTAAQGGALDIWGWYSYVTITNSTITNNTASTTGGGIYDEITVGYINLQNSIVAGNDGGDTAGPVTDQGGNLIGGDPKLGPLADNGGPTQTHLPLLGSPAIDAGSNTVCAAAPVNNLDQRGITRPIDGDGSGTATCDSGAVERNVALPTLSINDVTTPRGTAAARRRFFTVTRAGDTTGPSTVTLHDCNGTAFGGID
jgi:predicted outer membrane repeat protein